MEGTATRVDRALARTTIPPVLALGLVVAITNPLSAGPPPTARAAAVQATTPPPASGSGTSVGIPPVAFTSEVALEAGWLRTPVVLADDTVTAFATVEGATTDGACSADLVAGTPVWLECSVQPRPGQSPRVVVTLSDGRTVEHLIAD